MAQPSDDDVQSSINFYTHTMLPVNTQARLLNVDQLLQQYGPPRALAPLLHEPPLAMATANETLWPSIMTNPLMPDSLPSPYPEGMPSPPALVATRSIRPLSPALVATRSVRPLSPANQPSPPPAMTIRGASNTFVFERSPPPLDEPLTPRYLPPSPLYGRSPLLQTPTNYARPTMMTHVSSPPPIVVSPTVALAVAATPIRKPRTDPTITITTTAPPRASPIPIAIAAPLTAQDTLQKLRSQRLTSATITSAATRLPQGLSFRHVTPFSAPTASTFAALVARATPPHAAFPAKTTFISSQVPPLATARRPCLELQEPDDVPSAIPTEDLGHGNRRPTTQAETHEFNQKLYWKKAALKLEINKIPLIAKVEMHLSSQHMRWIVRQSLQLDTSAKRIADWQNYICWWGEGVQNFNLYVLHLPKLHTYAAKMKALSVHPETVLRLDELDAKFTSGEPPSLVWFAIIYVAGPILLAIGLRIIIYIFGERLGILGSAFEMWAMGNMNAATLPSAIAGTDTATAANAHTNGGVPNFTGMIQQVMGYFNTNTNPAVPPAVVSTPPLLPTGMESGPSTVLTETSPTVTQPTATTPVRTRRYQPQFTSSPA